MSLDIAGTNSAIFQPFMAMLLLTLTVWVILFIRRLTYLTGNKIDAEDVKTPEQANSILPLNVNAPANNFTNLCEVPVIFYAVCVAAFSLQLVDGLLLNCAWAFVALRVVHSIVHCTYNRVMHRFMAYLGSSLLVWFMVVKVALGIF